MSEQGEGEKRLVAMSLDEATAYPRFVERWRNGITEEDAADLMFGLADWESDAKDKLRAFEAAS